MADEFDITDPTVGPLGLEVLATTGTTGLVPESLRWDCSIGGMPFLFGFSDQFPFQRETASFRRDRVDTERNPGEQSLDSGFWLRSQSSWHYGSGLLSAEPLEIAESEAQFRYQRGGGVNPWTAGQLTLLNDTEKKYTSTGSSQFLLGVDTGVLHADATTVSYHPNSGASAAVTWGGSASAITSMTADGGSYYVANAVGIYKGSLPSGTGSKIWDTGGSTLVRWVKSRLMAAVGASVYELATGGPTLPTALYTHPTTGWTWTDMAEGPAAIYLSGYAGSQSFIYRVSVESTTSTVTLDVPTVVAELPRGETALSLYAYVGTYLVIGTNKGARVAAINSDGSLTLGPLVVESTDGCRDAVADGSFVYLTVGSKGEAGNRAQRAGLYRIDLGTNLNNAPLRFAAAADLVVPSGVSGSATQVTVSGGKLWFTVTTQGVYRQATTYVTDGWLETGRIRLGTIENKAWREIRVLADRSSNGTIAAYATLDNAAAPSGWRKVIQISGTNRDSFGSLNTVAPTAQPGIFVAFKLTRGSSTTTPVFVGYQVKAVPAPKRSELIRVPLLCFDFEVDRQGARYGKPGGSRERFAALKELEAAGGTVSWRDNTTSESAEAYIERVEFYRTTPPTRQVSGNGGIATVLLRLV